MKKTTGELVDELTITNIKIYHLKEKIDKKTNTPEDKIKLADLNKYRLEIYKALDKSTPINKSISSLIDELTITNIKIYHLVDKILADTHTRIDAKKAQDLNRYRSQLCNSLNKAFKERENIKV